MCCPNPRYPISSRSSTMRLVGMVFSQSAYQVWDLLFVGEPTPKRKSDEVKITMDNFGNDVNAGMEWLNAHMTNPIGKPKVQDDGSDPS
mmetsp:Transcript_23493/g.23924  ORF Transcript_23493/g.23924 Transcript_23493/m.23924 type:complete len:89 (-) Transcript_23493:65-331(-)